MKVTYHGHSFLEIRLKEASEFTILIDPFITGNPSCDVKPDDISCDYIILTHAHGDHLGDAPELAKKNNAVIISTFEICQHLSKQDLKTHDMGVGGCYSFPFGKVKFTNALHSSSFPDGTYGGNPAGVLLFAEGRCLYHAGDTALFSDMKLIGESSKINHAFLPIGDNYTMGIDDAVKAVQYLDPHKVTPIHYNTFDVIKTDPEEFKKKVSSIGKQCLVMMPGDNFTL